MICVKCGFQNPNWENYCEGCGVKLLKIAYSEQRFYGALDIVNDDSDIGESRWNALDSQAARECMDACEGILTGAVLMDEFVQVAEFHLDFSSSRYEEMSAFEPDKDTSALQMEIHERLMDFLQNIYNAAEFMLQYAGSPDPATLDEAKEYVEKADASIYAARQLEKRRSPELAPLPEVEEPGPPPPPPPPPMEE